MLVSLQLVNDQETHLVPGFHSIRLIKKHIWSMDVTQICANVQDTHLVIYSLHWSIKRCQKPYFANGRSWKININDIWHIPIPMNTAEYDEIGWISRTIRRMVWPADQQDSSAMSTFNAVNQGTFRVRIGVLAALGSWQCPEFPLCAGLLGAVGDPKGEPNSITNPLMNSLVETQSLNIRNCWTLWYLTWRFHGYLQ